MARDCARILFDQFPLAGCRGSGWLGANWVTPRVHTPFSGLENASFFTSVPEAGGTLVPTLLDPVPVNMTLSLMVHACISVSLSVP